MIDREALLGAQENVSTELLQEILERVVVGSLISCWNEVNAECVTCQIVCQTGTGLSSAEKCALKAI